MKRQLCACLGLIRVYAGGGTLIMLKQLEELVAFQRVMVEVKALHEEEAMEVSGGKKNKQDISVGDSSGTARLTVWESERWQKVTVTG